MTHNGESTITCTKCGAEKKTKLTQKGAARLPRGWKRHRGVWCAKCWHDNYVIRAISIPVVRPLGDGIGWPEFRDPLAEAWSHTTAAINWMVSQLWAADHQRMPADEKLEKMPSVYLYPQATEKFPHLPTQSVASLESTAKAKYLKRRYETVWTCGASLPNARYPQPFITPNQSWRASYEPAGKDGGDQVPCVTVTLLRGQRFLLQLRGGKEFRRQLSAFRQIVNGDAIQGELQILRKRVNTNDRRNGTSDRDGGGQKVQYRVIIKMVAWFPRRMREPSGTLYVRTDSESFLVALDEHGGKLRLWHCDHVRRWISEHRRQIQRWSDDQKAEQRPTAKFQSRRERAVHKFRNRITSHRQETCAQIVGLAKRLRYSQVQFDDSDHSYFGDRFDWSGFRTYLQNKCNDAGVGFTLASGGEPEKTGSSLAEKEGEK